ncbi:hypothetical protein Pcinc_011732 [Petrolisthes cinctipes]|uniref:Uncharacterized protein n=1 Tax=Petrolisthes cinctipes TaxID=88211 RepID=A0AAE1G220_PETCI|nr:hypothetical protein Pcinc_011732 [Petrolisthes cinctipes]
MAGLVQPTLIHPIATEKYTVLKNGLLQSLGKSRYVYMQELNNIQARGHRPSLLIAHMQALAACWRAMHALQLNPPRPSPYRSKHVPQDLASAEHVFIRQDAKTNSLQSPYDGPIPVVSHSDKLIASFLGQLYCSSPTTTTGTTDSSSAHGLQAIPTTTTSPPFHSFSTATHYAIPVLLSSPFTDRNCGLIHPSAQPISPTSCNHGHPQSSPTATAPGISYQPSPTATHPEYSSPTFTKSGRTVSKPDFIKLLGHDTQSYLGVPISL